MKCKQNEWMFKPRSWMGVGWKEVWSGAMKEGVLGLYLEG